MEKKFNKESSDRNKEQNDILVIKKLYKILNEYQELTFDIENSIYDKICTFLKKELGDIHPPLDSTLFYEKTAFALEESLTQCSSKMQGWEGLTYRPMYSLVNQEGYSIPQYPIIKHITPEMVNYYIEFVKIHPFVDGNGRTARLLQNLELMKAGFPPIIIKKEQRLDYYNSLDKAHTTNQNKDFIKISANSLEKSLDLYLNTIRKR